MGQNVLFVLREPDAASSRCASGVILGIENVHPRTMIRELLSQKNHFNGTGHKREEEALYRAKRDGRNRVVESYRRQKRCQ